MTAPTDATPVDGAAPEQDPTPAAEAVPGEEALGDPGKKALDAMKAERNAARAEAKSRADEIAQLRARIEGKEAEYAAEQAKRATEAAALAKANERILKAEIRAAAAGKLADPADALRYLDPSTFDVGDDGETDAAAIAAAIDDLISTKPYLAAQGRRFQGGGDGGARKETDALPQLTESEVKALYDARKYGEIEAARKAGRLNKVLGITH